MRPTRLYALRYIAAEYRSDALTVYRERPQMGWDFPAEIIPFSVPDLNLDKQLFALVERTRRNHERGQKILILAYSRSRLRSMATFLNSGTPAWSHADEPWNGEEVYRVVPVEIADQFHAVTVSDPPPLAETAWDSGMVLE